ncbi:hypothetical protein [Streptomyces prunicolor]|uniref:hypothetical protein n=1 Tax=Streptomyces prunicolor TaxID=67348 RepID=UPI000360295E|nr:hypothetical protein [Streptomyces prunicolor]
MPPFTQIFGFLLAAGLGACAIGHAARAAGNHNLRDLLYCAGYAVAELLLVTYGLGLGVPW